MTTTNTRILQAIEQILIELRRRDDQVALEESVRLRTNELVISMRDFMAVLTDHTRRLEALKDDQGALREDLRLQVLQVRRELEILARDFRDYEQANQLPPVSPHALPPAVDDDPTP